MDIEIENYPEAYDKMIYTAGRNCYGCRDAAKTMNKTAEQMAKFTLKLVGKGHESVLEHVCISVYAKDVSRSFLAQITRHRLVSYSVRSQHYVKHNDFKYKELENYGNSIFNKMKYNLLMNQINKLYKDMINTGVPHYIAREVLPNSCLTDIYMTANAREWRHIIKMRIGKENTPEIRAFARTILRELYTRMPSIFTDQRDKYLEAYE